MNRIITAKELVNGIIGLLEESVADFFEEEREEAKCRLLNAFSEQMFYGSVKKASEE